MSWRWFRANWFSMVVALTTIVTSISGVITDWLSEGYLWSFLPPVP